MSGFGRRILALVVLVVAAVSLAFVMPRLQASLHYLPVDTAINRYFDSGELPSAQLPALARRAEEAIARYPHYRYYDGLSFIEYLRAIDLAGKPWLQRPALNRSVTAGLEALRRAPAKPRTWLRVARARAALDQGEGQVASALKMSILTGRVEPTLLLPRLELGYAYLEQLDAETVNLLRDQTLLAWRVDERAFRRSLEAGRLDLSRVKSVIGNNEDAIVREMEGRT